MEEKLNKIIEETILKENESLILFLNTQNGFSINNPIADLVIVENYNHDLIKNNEKNIPGVYHRGGNWQEALTNSNLKYKLLISGKKNEFEKCYIDGYGDIINYIQDTYIVISGTY